MSEKVFGDAVPAGSSWVYEALLTMGDKAKTPVGSNLAGLTLTFRLYSLDAARTVITETRSILNVNGGTLDVAGNLRVTLTPAQNPILDPTVPIGGLERHEFLLTGLWNSGGGGLRRRVRFDVERMA